MTTILRGFIVHALSIMALTVFHHILYIMCLQISDQILWCMIYTCNCENCHLWKILRFETPHLRNYFILHAVNKLQDTAHFNSFLHQGCSNETHGDCTRQSSKHNYKQFPWLLKTEAPYWKITGHIPSTKNSMGCCCCCNWWTTLPMLDSSTTLYKLQHFSFEVSIFQDHHTAMEPSKHFHIGCGLHDHPHIHVTFTV